MRDVIMERKREDWKSDLRVREVELRTTVASIHAAAGNKPGVREAAKITLFERTAKERPLPSTEAVMGLFRGR